MQDLVPSLFRHVHLGSHERTCAAGSSASRQPGAQTRLRNCEAAGERGLVFIAQAATTGTNPERQLANHELQRACSAVFRALPERDLHVLASCEAFAIARLRPLWHTRSAAVAEIADRSITRM